MTDNLAAENKQELLPEILRQQYLKSMGIQTWFDPALIVSESINTQTQKAATSLDEPVGEEVCVAEKNMPDISVSDVYDQRVDTVTNLNENIAAESLDELAVKIAQCELCELHTTRQRAVIGEGAADAKIFIIIDAPINDAPGESGLFNVADKNMLQAMLDAIGCQLSSVFITSLVKCCPPGQRAPQISEMICCDDHLSAQIKLVQPDVIFILGEQASQQLLVSQKSLTDLRLRHHKHLGVPVYASYHPHDLFSSSETKRKVWADLLQIKQLLK